MKNKRLISIFIHIKQILHDYPHDIQRYLMDYVLTLLYVNVSSNEYGFIIKKFGDVLIYNAGEWSTRSFLIHKQDNNISYVAMSSNKYGFIIKKFDDVLTYDADDWPKQLKLTHKQENNISDLCICTLQNVDTITLFETNHNWRCMYVLFKNGKFMISEGCVNGLAWITKLYSDIPYTDKLVEMKINDKGSVSQFAYTFGACFVIINNKLYSWGDVLSKIIIDPIQIMFPKNDFPKVISCDHHNAFILTNKGHVYKLHSSTLQLQKIKICGKVRSIYCNKRNLFVLTKNKIFMLSLMCGIIKLNAPNNVIKMCRTDFTTFFVTKDGKLFVSHDFKNGFHLVKINNVVDVKSNNGFKVLIVTEDGIYEYITMYEDFNDTVPHKIMDL